MEIELSHIDSNSIPGNSIIEFSVSSLKCSRVPGVIDLFVCGKLLVYRTANDNQDASVFITCVYI